MALLRRVRRVYGCDPAAILRHVVSEPLHQRTTVPAPVLHSVNDPAQIFHGDDGVPPRVGQVGYLLRGENRKLALLPRCRLPVELRLIKSGGRVLRMTISQRAGRWYASLTVERDDASVTRKAPRGGAVGVDLGIKTLATLSDGTVIENPRHLAASERNLKRVQQALSRKTKGSNRRAKAKATVARIHARVANQRLDGLHKLTTRLAKEHSDISIEDLHVAGMVKNRHLAKPVSDAAFGEFRRQLEYKTARSGTALRVVDRWYGSSQTCSKCGSVKAKHSLAERTYRCDSCGLTMDRDLNAAINIHVAGSAPETLNARGGDVRRSDLVSGNADPGEARTKRAQKSAVRLGAGLGNEAIQPRII